MATGDHSHHDHPPDAHAGHTHAGHDHSGHAHGGHGHSHAPRDFGTAFAIGTALNLAFVVVEAICGVLGQSVALVADAGHNLGDVLGLVMAWVAASLARRLPSPRYTYGLRRGTILAALGNAVLLLVAIGAIALESIHRLLAPEPPATGIVMLVAGIGILINGGTALLFASGRKDDINVRGAFLHMAADALISLGVMVAAGVIAATGWIRLDPLVSLVIAGIILVSTWNLLRDSTCMAMDAVPPGIDAEAVRRFLRALPGVTDVHDLHIWSMSTTETALTGHLLIPGHDPCDSFLADAARGLKTQFGIGHATLQIEVDEHSTCALAPGNVV